MLAITKKYLLSIAFLLIVISAKSQRVGLVLSGGGASGMAHIGVLIALEENGIPIDYITGTSAGALIGSLYAVGYTPQQIKEMATSDEYFDIANGVIDKNYIYFFKENAPNANIVNFSFDKNFKLASSIPLNFTDPSLIDYFMIERFTTPSSYVNYNFDSLLVPFRCVASDIDANREIVFKKGNLSEVVRASMTFPFYIPPLKIDGKILVDGGLYNNFPADVMYTDFIPDVIIGSSVTAPRETPEDYDLLSQVRSMIQTKSNFEINCDNSIILKPDIDEIGTFDFQLTREAIRKGYLVTIQHMDSIKSMVYRRVDSTELSQKRQDFFQNTQKEIVISDIKIEGVKKGEEKYFINALKEKKGPTTLSIMKRKYFRLITDEKIKFMFPRVTKNTTDDFYTLHVKVKKEPEFDFRVGGSFTSKANNTGYIGLDYKNINKYVSLTAASNFYFGRFYNSIDIAPRIDFPLDLPFYIEPYLTYNRWDYYRSLTTFFDDTKPSYLIKNEAFAGISLGLPASNKSKIVFDYKNGVISNEYYQTDQFLSVDTADRTQFFFNDVKASFERNSLDNLYYSKDGSKLKISGSFTAGSEVNRSGSTSLFTPDSLSQFNHEWIKASIEYEQYFRVVDKYNVGLMLHGVFSNQPFFNNYTASILMAPQFSPIPETQTQFIPSFTANIYAGVGVKNVMTLYKSLDLRLEGYAFLPYANILDVNKKAEFTNGLDSVTNHYIASAIIVFNSPLGPASFTTNYMDYRENKWSFLFNFNFLIFNRKGLNHF